MSQLTTTQMGAVANARQALDEHAACLPALVGSINASTALPWATDADTFFGVLGDRAAALWRDNGRRIEYALSLGATYADIDKPDRICVVCADGHVVPSPVLFPETPLAVWHIPAADLAAAEAIAAQDDAVILAALAAAQ